MTRLDVVAELAAHQQNLTAEPAVAHAVVLALPPPIVCTLVAAEAFAALRRDELETAAREAGGGDGPPAIVELAPGFLDELWHRGIRELIVHGALGRPGHMRAVRYRWPGALRASGPSIIDALFVAHAWPAPHWCEIAPGVVVVAPGEPAPRDAELVIAATGSDDDPRWVRTRDHIWPYAVDPHRRLGPWSGVLPPAGLFATEAGASIRARWDAHWTAVGRAHVVRCAALGLDPDLEAMLRGPIARAPEPRDRRARLIAITGIDGSGKSSQVSWLAEELHGKGARVEVVKLYRQGAFLELANQLGARTRRGGPLAAFVTSRVVKLIDSLRVYRDQLARALAEADVAICDRYVETHLAAAESQLGWDLAGHPALAPFPPADVRFWLSLDPEVALRRRNERGEPPSADEHAVGLAGYASVFARLAANAPPGSRDGAREVVLDATAPADDNRRAIRDRVAPTLAPFRGDPARSSLVPSRGVARRTAKRCAIHIGGELVAPELFELGAEVLALRAALDAWCGPTAARAPEAFWLEAYAAQMVLDLWTLDVSRARIALWPGALAEMASHESLEMLRELARMLAPLVEIEGYDPRPEAYVATFTALGAAPRAALRLARDHAAQLTRLADAGGWPPTS